MKPSPKKIKHLRIKSRKKSHSRIQNKKISIKKIKMKLKEKKIECNYNFFLLEDEIEKEK